MEKNGEKPAGLKAGGRLWLIICGIAAGALLIILGSSDSLFGGREADGRGSAGEVLSDSRDLAEYTKLLEEKIASLCSKVDGVGRVSVAVSFNSGYEYVYAKDEEYRTSDSGSEYSSEYVINGKGSSQGMVYIKELLPEICGVGIVCDGGGSTDVQNRLIMLISSAFGISSNKIYVVKYGIG